MSPAELHISPGIQIPMEEITLGGIRAQGSGGQNVNKVSSAIHLRFDIRASSLPNSYKQKLLRYQDNRISAKGVIIIKSQQHRSQEKNRRAALERLAGLIREATAPRKPRKPTRPTAASQVRRVDNKVRLGQKKSGRRKPDTGG